MSVFYLDYVNGLDATTATPLGWWSVAYTGGTAPAPAADEVVTGATSGSTAKLTVVVAPTSGTWAGNNAAGTMYFYGKSAPFQSEQVNFAGGGHMHITADFTYCAWRTISTAGSSAARMNPGDTVRVAQSPIPYSIGNATWTSTTTTGGGFPATQNIASSTNAAPINIHLHGHGYSTDDIIQVIGHTTNTQANGIWQITRVGADDFTLNGSYGNGVGGATGTVQKVNSKCLLLDTARTAEIDRCEINWTAGASGDTTPSSLIYTTLAKEGAYCQKILLDASPQTNMLQAYDDIYTHDTTVHNFSAYQYLSLWFHNFHAVAANNWWIALCSDTVGAVPVDIFQIPANTVTNVWLPLTLARAYSVAFTGGTGAAPAAGATLTGATSGSTAKMLWSTLTSGTWAGGDAAGTVFVYTRSAAFSAEQVDQGANHFHIGSDFTQGNLGSAIKSVAIYTGSVAPTASTYVYLDNMIATKTNDLNLQSLVSKNPNAQHATTSELASEGWYGIQSINQRVVVLDNEVNSKPNAGRGYSTSGTSPENVASYARETIKTDWVGSGSNVFTITESGSNFTTLESYEGGYDPATNSQTGMTIFDGLNGYGRGLYATAKYYWSANWLSFVRYEYGMYLENTTGAVFFPNIGDLNNNSSAGYYSTGTTQGWWHTNIFNINNNAQGYKTEGGVFGIYADKIMNVNNNNSYGIYIAGQSGAYAAGTKVKYVNNVYNNAGNGIHLVFCSNSWFGTMDHLSYNTSYGLALDYTSKPTWVVKMTTAGNATAGVLLQDPYFICGDYDFSEGTGISINNHDFCNSKSQVTRYNGNYARIDMDRAVIVSRASTLTHGTGTEWYFTNDSYFHSTYYPIRLVLARVACVSGSQVTAKAWFKKGHATNVGAALVVIENQIAGVVAAKSDCPSDTNENELTVQYTPTENGVVEIEAWLWYVAGSSNLTVDAMTITQA